MPKFIPDWDIRYLFDEYYNQYCVIKSPETRIDTVTDPKTKEETDVKRVVIQEGVTVLANGRWYYWKLRQPVDYELWKMNGNWSDRAKDTPDVIVKAKLAKGVLVPQFKPRNDNNWGNFNRIEVPNHLTTEMLDNLALAHLLVSEELREEKPQPTPANG